MLELSGNITMINRLKAVVENLNNKYEHIKNFSRDGNRKKKKMGVLAQDDNVGRS